MKINVRWIPNRRSWLVFALLFGICLAVGAASGVAQPVGAAPAQSPAAAPAATYAGSDTCAACHTDIHTNWLTTRHAQAFSSPIFQRDWTQMGSKSSCLACHTTGYDATSGSYAFPGVTCESCHGPFQPNHPQEPMPITPSADLCGQCHKSTTDEWRTSKHAAAGIRCQSCHDVHSQTPKAPTVTDLCTNCHKDRGSSFTHSTHSNAGLECSNCHMYTSPRTNDPIEGLVPTGHTFAVGSEACIGCHQDTVHTRNTILALSGQTVLTSTVDTKAMEQTIQEQKAQITDLKTSTTLRLYTGLAQGAIVGLITGGAAAWVVGRRIRVVEEGEEDEDD